MEKQIDIQVSDVEIEIPVVENLIEIPIVESLTEVLEDYEKIKKDTIKLKTLLKRAA